MAPPSGGAIRHCIKTTRTIEYLVKGSGPVTVQYSALKGGTARATVELR